VSTVYFRAAHLSQPPCPASHYGHRARHRRAPAYPVFRSETPGRIPRIDSGPGQEGSEPGEPFPRHGRRRSVPSELYGLQVAGSRATAETLARGPGHAMILGRSGSADAPGCNRPAPAIGQIAGVPPSMPVVIDNGNGTLIYGVTQIRETIGGHGAELTSS
jgi:hypothetical protein